jgi:hypothetical protein
LKKPTLNGLRSAEIALIITAVIITAATAYWFMLIYQFISR